MGWYFSKEERHRRSVEGRNRRLIEFIKQRRGTIYDLQSLLYDPEDLKLDVALFEAVRSPSYKYVETLLNAGADAHKPWLVKMAIPFDASDQEMCIHCLKALARAGVTLDLPADEFGDTPLAIAKKRGMGKVAYFLVATKLGLLVDSDPQLVIERRRKIDARLIELEVKSLGIGEFDRARKDQEILKALAGFEGEKRQLAAKVAAAFSLAVISDGGETPSEETAAAWIRSLSELAEDQIRELAANAEACRMFLA